MQFSDKDNSQHFYNVLLLIAIVHCYAIDTSICERGFSLMNLLKTARRSRMGEHLLRLLMVICTLGAEWKDPEKIPVKDILDIWRGQSKKGRYEGEIWKAHMLKLALAGAGGGDTPAAAAAAAPAVAVAAQTPTAAQAATATQAVDDQIDDLLASFAARADARDARATAAAAPAAAAPAVAAPADAP